MSGIVIPSRSVNLGMHVGATNWDGTVDQGWYQLGSPARENYLDHVQAKGITCVRVPYFWEDLLDGNNSYRTANQSNYAYFVQQCYLRGISTISLIHTNEIQSSLSDQHLYDLAIWVYQHAGPSGSWWSIWGYPTTYASLVYEIYNEPNSGTSPLSYYGYPDPADYGAMVTPIYQQLRCPDGPGGPGTGYYDKRVRVICGGLRYSVSNPPDTWLNGLINSGTLYCDHIGLHPYPKHFDTTGNADSTAMVANCQTVLNNHSATQVLVMTEYAYPADVSEADQKTHADSFLGSGNVNGHHVSWFPAGNIAAEGFKNAAGAITDCRLATTTTASNWGTWHDRTILSSFPQPGTSVILP